MSGGKLGSRPAGRLEALNELAYLRIFISWEFFLEETFLRYLCGFQNSVGPLTLWNPPFPSLEKARQAMLNKSDFVSWYAPKKIIARSRKFIDRGPHELIVQSNESRLEWFAAIRNRVAHASGFARDQFDKATTGLIGRTVHGSRAGLFLRSLDSISGSSWLFVIAIELENLASQITP
jgi:hypothetical protein